MRDGDHWTRKKVAPEQHNNKSCYNFTNIVRKCSSNFHSMQNVDYVHFNMRQLVQPAFFCWFFTPNWFHSTTVTSSFWCCCYIVVVVDFVFFFWLFGPFFGALFWCVFMCIFVFIFLRCIKISHDELCLLAKMRRSLCCWNVEYRCLYTVRFENQIYTASVRISVFLPVCAFFPPTFIVCLCVSLSQSDKYLSPLILQL